MAGKVQSVSTGRWRRVERNLSSTFAIPLPSPRPMPDKLLFTPGPLTTSPAVKQAMLRDLGSRDSEFIEMVRSIRRRLLALAGVSQAQGYECILMQGSGTFGVESVLSSVIPLDGKLCVLVNGAYGERIAKIAARLAIMGNVSRFAENQPVQATVVELTRAIAKSTSVVLPTHLAVVHSETTSGILNPLEGIARDAKEHGVSLIVDAMSSFGAYPINVAELGIDYLISSANKCIEGVPGFAFVIARREALLASEGNARSLSLDLHAQWRGLEQDGQFRFTPPTHAVLAFQQALDELDAEGSIAGRADRYKNNHAVLVGGMRTLGFKEYVPEPYQSHIITTFHYPSDPKFVFEDFYRRLSDKGFVIYPGKLTKLDCFRIGNIGRLYPKDMEALVGAIETTLKEMGVKVPVETKLPSPFGPEPGRN
jgi:2-aminoethylphosphonate-pyruvate transaminase